MKVNYDRVKEYLDGLTQKEQGKAYWLIEQLEMRGRNLPHFNSNWAKVVRESRHTPELLELRVNIGKAVICIAYYIDTHEVAHLLWGGDKKGQKDTRFYKRLILEADRAIDSIKATDQPQET